MTSPRVSTAIGVDQIPREIRFSSAMPHPDYADMYVTTVTVDASAEEWARAVVEATPFGREARRLWTLLGLRLGPPGSATHIQGWRIAAHGRRWIRLETGSWYMTAHAVVHCDRDELSLALFLHYDRPVARLVWAFVSRMHRRAVPMMLQQATGSSTPSHVVRVERSEQ